MEALATFKDREYLDLWVMRQCVCEYVTRTVGDPLNEIVSLDGLCLYVRQ